MQTYGPRRHSKLELCSNRQLQQLAQEFCYDVEFLRKVSETLAGRTCGHSAHIRRQVERQLRALTALPPALRQASWTRPRFSLVAATLGGAVVFCLVVDAARQLLLG
jgi:hypothetical protein